ncbi:MAG: DUF5685 family protein [Lachnospiraceae bacterium]|nr:DUF5685 family protein [Lachnospiraceae bacterium]
MFGYVVADRPELKLKELYEYKSYYCGLCNVLKEKYSIKGQLTLSYDMTFVILLLSSLYEPSENRYQARCLIHPLEKHAVTKNEFTEYVSDMNILMTYYKCIDDWKDEKKFSGLTMARALNKSVNEIKNRYPKKVRAVKKHLKEIWEYEKRGEGSIDLPAGAFGNIMAEIVSYKEDEWEALLRNMGFYLGKFIYILDAYDDMEEDRKKGNYNPFLIKEGADINPEDMLEMMMGECCKSFERLPIIKNVNILRNILYSGVWSRFVPAKKESK